jgi:protein-disulfide isomerase
MAADFEHPMTDEPERDDDGQEEAEEQPKPRRKTTKKKRRKRAAAAVPAERARPKKKRRAAPPPEPEPQSWTTGHLVMALVVGLGVGAVGARMMGSNAAMEASKDSGQPPTAGAPAPRGARPAAPGQQPQDDSRVYVALADYSPTMGPKRAKVTILEFSDFQ